MSFSTLWPEVTVFSTDLIWSCWSPAWTPGGSVLWSGSLILFKALHALPLVHSSLFFSHTCFAPERLSYLRLLQINMLLALLKIPRPVSMHPLNTLHDSCWDLIQIYLLIPKSLHPLLSEVFYFFIFLIWINFIMSESLLIIWSSSKDLDSMVKVKILRVLAQTHFFIHVVFSIVPIHYNVRYYPNSSRFLCIGASVHDHLDDLKCMGWWTRTSLGGGQGRGHSPTWDLMGVILGSKRCLAKVYLLLCLYWKQEYLR